MTVLTHHLVPQLLRKTVADSPSYVVLSRRGGVGQGPVGILRTSLHSTETTECEYGGLNNARIVRSLHDKFLIMIHPPREAERRISGERIINGLGSVAPGNAPSVSHS